MKKKKHVFQVNYLVWINCVTYIIILYIYLNFNDNETKEKLRKEKKQFTIGTLKRKFFNFRQTYKDKKNLNKILPRR